MELLVIDKSNMAIQLELRLVLRNRKHEEKSWTVSRKFSNSRVDVFLATTAFQFSSLFQTIYLHLVFTKTATAKRNQRLKLNIQYAANYKQDQIKMK